MIFSNVDSIVRRTLLEKGLSIHYYLEFLLHTTAAIRELSFDSLQIVNTLSLPINEYNAIYLPGDFVDDVGLSLGTGTILRQLHRNDAINPLRYHDSTATYIAPPSPGADVNGQTFYGLRGLGWYWNINEYGEPTGRYFGARGASDRDGYKVIRERRQIQLSNTVGCDTAILVYISDGQSIDNASQVDVLAYSTIQAYDAWKRSPNADMKDSPQARTYYNEKRTLRARKDEISVTDIIQIVRRSYTAAMKG